MDKTKEIAIAKAVGDPLPEPEPTINWPEPETRDERQRELDALKKRRSNLTWFTVQWPGGVQINGVNYEGRVQVDQETADELRRLVSHRFYHEQKARLGDGDDSLHMISMKRPLGTW